MRRVLAIILFLPFAARAAGSEGYYRFPAIHGDRIIFTAEGDLWTVGVEGGRARRLTSHHGVESNAAISPDGRTAAFSAQYEGPTEVYVMPVDGGLPKRLTFEGQNALVAGWTHDGRVLYATGAHATLPNTQLAAVDPEAGRVEMLPLAQAADGCYDGAGNTLFFTRLPFQGSHTKRYTGGTVQNIWRFDAGSGEAESLTSDYAGTSKSPMWSGGRVYFVSDRDGTMNLWSMSEEGGDLRQHTRHKGWDVDHPCLHGGRIVYRRVADLFIYDIGTGSDRKLEVTLASDFDQMREQWVKEPIGYLTAFDISPDGDRVALTARGQVFVAPAKEGRFVRVTREDGTRYRDARFIPDGKTLLALSDGTGELEFVSLPANGIGDELPLTSNGGIFRFDGIPSPDGKRFAFTDKNYELWIHDMERGRTERVARSRTSNFRDISWSPDGRWIAFVANDENLFARIMLYGLDSGETIALTSERVESDGPVWSPGGKLLYFLSERHFRSVVQSPWGKNQPEPFFDKTTKIYMIALAEDARSPFERDDEILRERETNGEDGERKDGKDGKKDGDRKRVVEVHIDLEGIRERILEVPVAPGNYSGLAVNDKALFYLDLDRTGDGSRSLTALEITNEDPKPKKLVEGVTAYAISQEGSKLAVRKGTDIYVIDASPSPPSKLDEARVDLGSWRFPVLPRDEWRQMLVEAWRLERDYFYDPNLHGVDYDGLLARHLPLVERVTDRDELNDLIAHLVGELSALHTFVIGGDRRRGEDSISPASLGARLVRDERAGGYRIEHIFRTDPDLPEALPPMARHGIDVKEGDLVTAIDGVPVLEVFHPGELLEDKAGKQVRVTVAKRGGKETRDVIVKPLTPAEDAELRYDEWEYTRRLEVEEAGGGEIGYVHLRAMGGENISEWVRGFYPVFNRKGLIIDVRNNRGGNIDSWILEKLLRRAWFYWQPRVGEPFWNMQYAFRGHMVVLCNEYTASDGEAFAEGFRRLGLGTVIGTRTWGGEIWLSFSTWLRDRGIASAAELGVYGPEGEWMIEGHGVDPDIVVDNPPHAAFRGEDAQLRAAIEFLQRRITEEPVEVPVRPRYPDKSID